MSTDQTNETRAQESDEEIKVHGDQLSEAVKKAAGTGNKQNDEPQTPLDNSNNTAPR